MRTWIALCGSLLFSRTLTAQVSAREALISADRDLSAAVFKSGPRTVLPATLGPDGVILLPGVTVLQGGVAATRFFTGQPLLGVAHISWQPFRIEISADSSMGFLVGIATFDHPGADPMPPIHRIGRYLAAWKRVQGSWRLASLALVNLISTDEIMVHPGEQSVEMPQLRSSGPAGRFVAADSAFASDAAAGGAAKAFAKWAAPDAVTFAFSGEHNVGPERIGAVFAAGTSHWQWGPVAAGASSDGVLGWTVGLATITPAKGGPPSKSKYLTLWRKLPDGTIRFIADGGNARP